MARRVTILIADDQPRTRQSLRAWLSAELQPEEIYEVTNGQDAVLYAARHSPDLVVMDAKMAELDGIEATRIIKRDSPEVKVVVLSLYSAYRGAAMAAGADAFITKDEQPATLLATLSALLA